jgi:hypothetical protein
MTKGGYVIVKKNGKVTEEFGSKAKEHRFDKESRLDHRSEYRKQKGLLTELSSARQSLREREAELERAGG